MGPFRTVSLMACASIFIFCAPNPKNALANDKDGPYPRLATFASVLSIVEQLHVEQLDEDDAIIGAIKGMMRTLDPHSDFLMPEDLKMIHSDTSGEFGGVGMEVSIRDNVLTVITPMPETPAENAGIKPGDQILTIENQPTDNMSIMDSVKIMRGKPGTEVTITIRRPGKKEKEPSKQSEKPANEPFEVTLIREIIQVKSVKAEAITPGYLWIQVRSFQDDTTKEVRAAIKELSNDTELKGILLDLRRNPGGLLSQAVDLSDLFIKKGTIVTTKGRDGNVLQRFRAHRLRTYDDVPLVVLIDGASASASEIVSGALQDHGRALLVGTRTFGKGSVQSIIELDGGFGLKLTIALYHTPKDRIIQANGVIPDVLIESRNEPEPDEESAILAQIGEHKLYNHLNNSPKKNEDQQPKIEDYQLRIAFSLLRGLGRLEN